MSRKNIGPTLPKPRRAQARNGLGRFSQIRTLRHALSDPRKQLAWENYFSINRIRRIKHHIQKYDGRIQPFTSFAQGNLQC